MKSSSESETPLPITGFYQKAVKDWRWSGTDNDPSILSPAIHDAKASTFNKQPQNSSHPARTLYYLHLRRQAGSGAPVILSYPELGRALAVEDPQQPGGFAYQVNASQLTRLLDEIMNVDTMKEEGGGG